MADNTPMNALEICDGHRHQTGSHSRRVFSWRWILCVTIAAALLIAVMGILIAMFGPGSKDLKYHEHEDCKGKQGKQSVQLAVDVSLGFHCK